MKTLVFLLLVLPPSWSTPMLGQKDSDLDAQLELEDGGVHSHEDPYTSAARVKTTDDVDNDKGMCTGSYQEPASTGKTRPKPQTKCVGFSGKVCHDEEGRWGSSWCYVDAEGSNWGAQCVPCSEMVSYEDPYTNARVGNNVPTPDNDDDFDEGVLKYPLCNNYGGEPDCTLDGIPVGDGYCCPLYCEYEGQCPPEENLCGWCATSPVCEPDVATGNHCICGDALCTTGSTCVGGSTCTAACKADETVTSSCMCGGNNCAVDSVCVAGSTCTPVCNADEKISGSACMCSGTSCDIDGMCIGGNTCTPVCTADAVTGQDCLCGDASCTTGSTCVGGSTCTAACTADATIASDCMCGGNSCAVGNVCVAGSTCTPGYILVCYTEPTDSKYTLECANGEFAERWNGCIELSSQRVRCPKYHHPCNNIRPNGKEFYCSVTCKSDTHGGKRTDCIEG